MNQSETDMLLPFNWFWSQVVPENVLECLNSDVEKLSENKMKGVIGIPGITKQDEVVRNSDILMLDPLHWFSGIMFNVTLASNTFAGWHFNVSTPEATQIAFYGIDQHYTWHSDSALMAKNNLIRKLTAICMLSDLSEYEGGKLEFEDTGEIELKKGDIIVFPSFSKHRVTPVTSGLRKTATMWVSGNRSW